MKTKLAKLYFWICDRRFLDGYLGLMGVILFYHILADYRGFEYIFNLTLRVGRPTVFHISLIHWRSNRTNCKWSTSAPFDFEISIGSLKYDTGKAEKEELHKKTEVSMAKWRAEEAEKERLIQAAKAANL